MIILFYSTSYLYRFTTHDQLTIYTMLNIPRSYMQSAWWANQNIHLLYDHLNHTLWKYVLYTSHMKYFFAKTTLGRTCLLQEGACGGGGLAKTSWSRTLRSPSIWKLPTKSDLIQDKLRSATPGTDWIEVERQYWINGVRNTQTDNLIVGERF